MNAREMIAVGLIALAAACAHPSLLKEARSSKWPRVRLAHLRAEPACALCGATNDLQVHHIVAFHIRPDLELDDANLVTLCDGTTNRISGCHLRRGHLGNLTNYNPNIRQECNRQRQN
jgi:hypothetical protein